MSAWAGQGSDLWTVGDYPGVLVAHRLRWKDERSVLALAFRIFEGPYEDRFAWVERAYSGEGVDPIQFREGLRALGIEVGRLGELGAAIEPAYGTRATIRVGLRDCANTFEAVAPNGGAR